MYELIRLSEKCFYIQSPAKIGVIKTGGDQVCLIDSGNDKSAGKKIGRALDANGWSLQAIFNTHSHADHVGGNRCLQSRTGCKVYAPGIELAFTEKPVLEPSYLYGANPPKELRHKFLMAQGSDALPLTQESLPEGLEMIPLPGHSWDMTGFRTEDDIVFLADCLSGRETLEKYRICFLVDVQAFLDTLEAVRNMKAKFFVPAHAEPAEDITPLADYNIQIVHEIGEDILKICAAPVSFEVILKQIFDLYGLTMTFEQHALVGSTVRSYLTWLSDQGRLKAVIDDNTWLYEAVV